MFRRRREKKTDYVQRLALLKSRKTRLVVRRALTNIHIQFIEYHDNGDKTAVEEISKNLKKYGWNGNSANMPAAYLTGLAAGLKAKKAGIEEAVADMGLQTSVRGSSCYAAVKGVIDAGVRVSLGSEAFPDDSRISGVHIAEYAKKIKSENEKYKKQFSGYIKKGIDPENLPKHFDDVRNKILSELK